MQPEEVQKILARADLTLDEKFKLVAGSSKPIGEAEQAKWHKEVHEEFYDENARGTITHFSLLLHDWEVSTKETYGEDSAEYKQLKAQIEPVREKLNELRGNLQDPEVKRVIEPLHELWAEYRGYYPNDKGGLEQRQKPLEQKVISSFWRTTERHI